MDDRLTDLLSRAYDENLLELPEYVILNDDVQ